MKYQFLKRGWIRVAADSILRLTRVPAARYELRLTRVLAAGYELQPTPSHGWLEPWGLDTSCGWLRPTTDWSSRGWIGVTADTILRLTRVPAPWYDLRLIPSCGWLKFWQLDTSCNWFCPAANSSSAGWTRLAAVLYFDISSKFKDLFCKIHHFYGLFSAAWFKLPLIQVWMLLQEPWRSLKKFQEAWRSFKTLAATDTSCSDWFELRRLIRDLRPIDYLQNFDPDAPW